MPKGRNYTGGSIVYFQDDLGDDIYILQKGRVILMSTATDTGEELKEEVKSGEFFGVKSALGNYPREETAQVLGHTQVIVFSSAEFEAYVLKNTRLIMTMARVFSKQLRDIHRQVRDILKADAIINPAFELLNVAESFFQAGQLEHAAYAFAKYIQFSPNGKNVKRAEDLMQMARKGMTYPHGFPPPEPEDLPTGEYELNLSQGMADASTVLNDPQSLDSMGKKQAIPKKNIENVFQEARDHFEKKDLLKAKDAFLKCTTFSHLQNESQTRIFHEAHYELGHTLIMLHQYKEAQEIFSNYIKDFPTGKHIKQAIYQMGVAAEALSNIDQARTLYSKVATMAPPDNITQEAKTRLEALA